MLKNSIVSIFLIASTLVSSNLSAQSIEGKKVSKEVQIQHIRNATEKVTYGETTFLVDPMLAEKDAYPGFQGTYRSEIRNPMLELPISVEEVLKDVDAVIVTHTHLDHWDEAAQRTLPKSIPIFVQHKADADLIKSQGFKDVRILDGNATFQGVTLHKVGGQHGSDKLYSIPQIAEVMGEVMGVIFEAEGYETTYVAGDTVWHHEVKSALEKFKPNLIVLNTGDAKLDGMEDSILMGKEDVLKANKLLPQSQIIPVHMDTLNHCTLSRSELAKFVKLNDVDSVVTIPTDGQTLSF